MFCNARVRHDGGRRLLTAAAVTVFASLLAPAFAAAAAAPTVTLKLPTSVNAGTRIRFSWSTSKLPNGSGLIVQTPKGHGWHTVLTLTKPTKPTKPSKSTKRGASSALTTLTTRSGSGLLPARTIGQGESYRLAAVNARGRVLASSVDSVNVFGTVSLNALSGEATSADGVYIGPASSVMYWQDFYANDDGPVVAVVAGDNNCSSVTVQYVEGDSNAGNWSADAGDATTVKIVQQSQRAVATSAPFNTTGSVTATLIPGQSWGIDVSDSENLFEPVTYLSGTAVCDSTAAWSGASTW